jgi:hypothetical protein
MKITEIIGTKLDGTEEIHVLIDYENGEFASMPKSVWNEKQAQEQQD